MATPCNIHSPGLAAERHRGARHARLQGAAQAGLAAHTDPKLFRRWMLGCPGWSMPVCEMDVRPGGKYRWRWRSDEDGRSSASSASSAKSMRPR